MVRDFSLIRRILFEVQSMPAGTAPQRVSFADEQDRAEVDEHVALLIDAGLMRGIVKRLPGGGTVALACDLTWDGHDFLASITDDGVWKKAVDTVLKPSAAMAFDVLKAWLEAQALAKLGLS